MAKHLLSCKLHRQFLEDRKELANNKSTRLVSQVAYEDMAIQAGGVKILEEMSKHMLRTKYADSTRALYMAKVRNEIIPHFEVLFGHQEVPFMMDSTLFPFESHTRVPRLSSFLLKKRDGTDKVGIQAYKVIFFVFCIFVNFFLQGALRDSAPVR